MCNWSLISFLKVVCIITTLSMAIIGVVIFVRGVKDYRLIMSEDKELIDICSQNPEMDCDPRFWKREVFLGLLALGLSGCLAVICHITNLTKPVYEASDH